MARTAAAAVMGLIFAVTFGIVGTQSGPRPDTEIHARVAALTVAGAGLSRSAHRLPSQRRATTARLARGATKRVVFDGYAFKVPSSWPVYRLGSDSTRCVRYDRSAVYLGTPGTDQDCPARLIGQADTISIQARPAAAAAGAAAGHAVAELRSAEQAAAPRQRQAALSISATYGGHPGEIGQILHTMRKVGTGAGVEVRRAVQRSPAMPVAAAGGSDASRSDAGRSDAGRSDADRSKAGPDTSQGTLRAATPQPQAPPAAPRSTPTSHASSPPTSRPPSSSPPPSRSPSPPSGGVAGFDTCGAPSVSAMRAWRQAYSAAAIYIGGDEMGCDYGNLSASWIQAVKGMGWSLLPLYVGIQAPCNSYRNEITPSRAAAQGIGSAMGAVTDARAFGMGRGTPIYFDMEGYDNEDTVCRNAVLTFLSSWTKELHALGYVSGVYSSAGSGAEDLANVTTVNGQAVTRPDNMWFALWDGRANLIGTPYLGNSLWYPGHRSKQYLGGHVVSVGGVSIDIDSDWVGSATY